MNNQEKNRYSRHILLNKVGEKGQQKLKNARVLVIGAGGLGCPILQYLTAAGIGVIGIVDFDVIEESNLQRQILFSVDDIGKNKAIVAKQKLEKLNPYVVFNVYEKKLTNKNAISIFDKYDIVVDGTDNFSTRYLVNDASVIMQKPLVYGAIYQFEGQVSVFNYQNGPSYRCLFPEPPKQGSMPNCSEVGVIGVLPGIIGVQQANEVLKIILQIGDSLSGKLLMYNALTSTYTKINIPKSEEEIQKVIDCKSDFKNIDYDLFCGISHDISSSEITLKEFMQLSKNSNIQIVDVRKPWELPRIDHLRPIIAPLDEIDYFIDKVSTTKKVIVCCQHGARSLAAINYLQKQHKYNNLINLKDGLSSYKQEKNE